MTTQQQITNTQFLTQIDQALSKSGLPQSKIEELIQTAAARLECDKECQKNRQIEKLKQNWIDSKKLYKELPNKISEHERAYYSLAKNETYYRDNILKQKYETQVVLYIQDQQEILKKIQQVMNTLLDSYKGETVALARIIQLNREVTMKNAALKKDVDNYYKKTVTAERKIYYEENEIDNLQFYSTGLKIIYYIVLAFYILFGPFIHNKHYKNKFVWIYLTIYIILPWVLKYIIDFIYDSFSYSF